MRAQRADLGLVDVRYPKSSGIQLIPGPHGADNGNVPGLGFHDQGDLRRDGIHGVYDIVILIKRKILRIFRQEECLMHRDLCIGIDVVDSCFHHIGFVLANGLSGGDDLPVEICQTYPVIVDQVKGANAAANQRSHTYPPTPPMPNTATREP